MMKTCVRRGLWGLGVLVASLGGFQNPAWAEVFRGEVISIRDDGNSLSIKCPDPSQPSLTKQFDIVMRPGTKLKNISSLKELAPGDSVVVDAVQKQENKVWEARSVRIFKLRLYQTDVAQKAQPD